ncbi:hypothetical protein BDZ94DRAFT_618242 [Collybia nuda]|uniref:Uncharacterized protein n=1 Tax=Collybia nuda TaxID=64659 RepID=A0A9P6CEW4_9AGAR|nr:hypothetical protein BDZ94DRAFT_618242 [Collybia nuda]
MIFSASLIILYIFPTVSYVHGLTTPQDDNRKLQHNGTGKQEAIASMAMGTYTEILLQFPKKFWFDTEVRHVSIVHYLRLILSA